MPHKRENINDRKNLTGASLLVNKSKIKKNCDISNIEKLMTTPKIQSEISKKIDSELKEFKPLLNIKKKEHSDSSSVSSKHKHKHRHRSKHEEESEEEESEEEENAKSNSGSDSDETKSERSSRSSKSSRSSRSSRHSSNSESSEGESESESEVGSDENSSEQNNKNVFDETNDESKSRAIENVLYKINPYAANNDILRGQTYRNELEQRINLLYESLATTGDCDMNMYSKPTPTSTTEELETMLSKLEHKNKSSRSSKVMEDVIVSFGSIVQKKFNGETEIFGLKPNYGGYERNLRVLYKRINPSLSNMYDAVMKSGNIGEAGRAIFELLLNFATYPLTRTDAFVPSTTTNNEKILNAYSELESMK
jgi:hypothetical protein